MVQQEEGMANRHTKFLQFIAQMDRSPFFEKMTYRHIKAGKRFVVQGEVENTAYIIKRGSCLVIVEKDGELHPVDHYWGYSPENLGVRMLRRKRIWTSGF
jgi:hypothetical protein